MESTGLIKKDVGVLRHDATKMIADLNKLRSDLSLISGDVTEELTDRLVNTVNAEVAKLRDRVNFMSKKLGQYAEVLEGEVSQRPYVYVAAAVGLGALVAALAVRRARRTLH